MAGPAILVSARVKTPQGAVSEDSKGVGVGVALAVAAGVAVVARVPLLGWLGPTLRRRGQIRRPRELPRGGCVPHAPGGAAQEADTQ